MRQKDPVIRFIQTEAYRKAKEAMTGKKFLHAEPGQLTVGQGTRYETTFAKNPDGTITASKPEALRNPLSARKSHESVFTQSWNELRATAHTILMQETSRIWREANQSFISVTGMDEEGEEATQERFKRISVASRAIAASLGNGYVTNPEILGNWKLRKLAGEDTAKLVVKVCGQRATIEHLNAVIRNRREIEEAYRQNPNATTLWAATQACQLEPDDHPTAAEIIDRARSILRQHLPTDSTYAEQSIWQTFSALSRRFVKEEMPHAENCANAAVLAWKAKAIPSYTASRYLPRIHCHNEEQTEIALAYIKVSAKPRINQKRLARPYLIDGIIQEKRRRPNTTVEEWETIITKLHAQVPPQETKKRRRDKRRSRQPETVAAKIAKQKLIENELSAHIDRLAEMTGNAVTILETPASVQVKIRGQKEPLMKLWRNSDGTISVSGETYPPELTDLPDPANIDASGPGVPTTQGAFEQAVLDAADTRVGKAARKLTNLAMTEWQKEVKFSKRNFDQNTDRRLAQSIARLIEPDTAQLCQQATGGLSLNNYNSTVRWAKFLHELIRTNPGITALTFLTPEVAGRRFNHPGQLIDAMKSETSKAGITPGQWKFLAKLPPETVRAAHNMRDGHARSQPQEQHCEDALTALRTMANAGTILSAENAERLIQAKPWYTLRYLRLSAIDRTHTVSYQAEQKLAVMVCKHLHQGHPPPSREQIMDLGDYIRNLNGRALAVKTLKGAIKASIKWHHQVNQEIAQREWNRRITENDGKYESWNCLLGEQEVLGYRFASLQDAKELFDEGKAMRHCVGISHHAADCAAGTARIFSVYCNGKHYGTTRITASGQIWLETETRTLYNGAPPDDMKNAAQTLAQIYTKAQQAEGYGWQKSETKQEPGYEAQSLSAGASYQTRTLVAV